MKLYVRVKPKVGVNQFYRCAILFTLAWLLVDVDEATKARLENEQMLETSEDKPEGYVEPAESAEADTAGNTSAANSSVVIPPVLSAEERLAEIKTAIGGLDKTIETNWVKSGAPNVAAITTVVGFDVTAAERDQVWAELEAERLAAEAAATADKTGAK